LDNASPYVLSTCELTHFSHLQVISAGTNPIQVARGIEKTTKALVLELKSMSREVNDPCLLTLESTHENGVN
jgi:chaperonin GroEL (HSP60 family)